MILTPDDYAHMVYRRVEQIRSILYPNSNRPVANGEEHRYPVPDFEELRAIVRDIGVIIDDYETSIGPA